MDEQSLPIDIQCRKLLDWLVSRRICNREWHENVQKVRKQIGCAIQDMPEHDEVRELLSGASINYFHCLRIVEILEETEKDTKNFFGRYGSQRMSDWKQIVSAYSKDSAYLAEAAQLLVQSVAYDIPATKKQISKLVQVQEECVRKEADNLKRADEFRAEFAKGCKVLGIEGRSVVREILALLDDLPAIYDKLAADIKVLSEHRDFYVEFNREVHLSVGGGFLPMLKFLVDRGNVTTYEWVHGEAPLSVVENRLDLADVVVDVVQIDVDEEEVELDAPAEIDWDDLGVDGNVDIDWDDVDALVDEGVTVEGSGVEGGVARDEDALSVLDNKRTRNALLDELHELLAFAEQRLSELSGLESGTSMSLLPAASSGGGERRISEAAIATRSFIERLSAGKLHQLQLVRNSPKYVNRLVDGLEQKQRLAAKVLASNERLKTKAESAIDEQSNLQAKAKLMVAKTKELQRNIELDISKRYKGRKVNVMGGAQSV